MNKRAREKLHLFSHRALFEAKQKPFLILAVLLFRSLLLFSRSTIWAHLAETSLARLACRFLPTVDYSCDCRGSIQLNICNFNSHLNKVRADVARKHWEGEKFAQIHYFRLLCSVSTTHRAPLYCSAGVSPRRLALNRFWIERLFISSRHTLLGHRVLLTHQNAAVIIRFRMRSESAFFVQFVALALAVGRLFWYGGSTRSPRALADSPNEKW